MEIKNILFDFDGVILDSNSIKDDAFRYIFRHYNKLEIDRFIEYHQNNGAVSRFVKIKYFFNIFLKKELNTFEYEQMLKEFSSYTLSNLSNKALLIKETIDFIKSNNYNYHIVSGTKEEDLAYLCEKLEIDNYFISINGSPTNKSELVKNVLIKYNYEKIETILIGDSINDYESANKNSVSFFGYNNLDLQQSYSYLDNYTSLYKKNIK